MGQLKSGRRTVKSVFHLRGFKEVHMTDSLAFVLFRVPRLLDALLEISGAQGNASGDRGLFVQRPSPDSGRTDIELLGPECHIICEAKRGTRLPSRRQLTKYAQRLHKQGRATRELLVLSDSEPGYAREELSSYGLDVSVLFLSWRQVHDTATRLAGSAGDRERVWLDELVSYLSEHLERIERPGFVRIVPLNRRPIPGRALSSIELLQQQLRYVHPVGNGYPTQPARLLGFRYDGYLQAVHQVLDVKKVSQLPADLAAPGASSSGSHFVYKLDAAMPLADKRQPGMPWRIRSGKIWDRPLRLPLTMLGDFKTLKEASAHQAAERKQKRVRKKAQAS